MPPSKYQPLADFLAVQPSETTSVTLALPEIEALLGQELPLATHHGNWWTTGPTQHQARVWLCVGWRVTRVQVRQAPSAITFARVSSDTTP